jgi:hypothetical protein
VSWSFITIIKNYARMAIPTIYREFSKSGYPQVIQVDHDLFIETAMVTTAPP